jgi:HSP20 family protein
MNEANQIEAKKQTVQPLCNISEENGKVLLTVEMPGVSREGLEVSVEKNELVIVGRGWNDSNGNSMTGEAYLIRERRTGEFRKRFIIDETIDREKIEAVMDNGILTLVLNTKEAAKPRKVEIR